MKNTITKSSEFFVCSGKQKYTKGYIFEYVKKITNTIPEVQYQ